MHRAVAAAAVITTVVPSVEQAAARGVHDAAVMTFSGLRFGVVDGATIPLNAVFFGHGSNLYYDPLESGAWWLLSDDEPIALSTTILDNDLVRLAPTAALAPSTTYTLRWFATLNPPDDDDDDDDNDDNAVGTLTLTTGTTADSTAPSAPPPSTITIETHALHANADSCSPAVDSMLVTFAVEPDEDVVAYRLRGDLSDTSVRRADGPSFLSVITPAGGVGAFDVVAIDGAGNESARVVVMVM